MLARCMTFEDARDLLTDPHACLRLQSIRRHLSLLPRHCADVRAGIRDQLRAAIGVFTHKLCGALLAYHNVQCLQQHSALLDDQPHLHFDVRLDCIVFQPAVGAVLRGVVNLVSRSHVGGLVHRYFNFAIPKSGGGGAAWRCGQTLLFEVVSVDSQNGVMSMKGALLNASISAPRGGGGLTSPCHERGDSVMSCDSGVDISIVSDSQPSERRKRKRTTLGDGSPGADATTHKKRRRKTEAIEIDCDGPHVRLFPDAVASSDSRHKHKKKKRKPSLCV